MPEYDIALIRGDGIGPEIIDAAAEVIESSGVAVRWHVLIAGSDQARGGAPMPTQTVLAVKRSGAALEDPFTTTSGRGKRSANRTLRLALALFACFRPTSDAEVCTDIVVARENTEDLYQGIEWRTGNVAQAVKT